MDIWLTPPPFLVPMVFEWPLDLPGLGFFYVMPQQTKLLVRKEVQLFTLINVFAEIGGYLGLLLGESILSYILIGSNWMQKIIKTCKEKNWKLNDQKKTESTTTKAMLTSQSFWKNWK